MVLRPQRGEAVAYRKYAQHHAAYQLQLLQARRGGPQRGLEVPRAGADDVSKDADVRGCKKYADTSYKEAEEIFFGFRVTVYGTYRMRSANHMPRQTRASIPQI